MKFYRYWERAEAPVETDRGAWNVRCYGGSNTSLEDALANASDIAKRTARAIEAGRGDWRYEYSERALREEIIEEFEGGGVTVAVITRNSYGSLVLNTNRALFADIDYPEARPRGFWQIIRSLFSGGSAPDRDEVDGEIISQLHEFTERRPEVGMRLYRTAAGYRCLFTHREFEPGSHEAQSLLAEIGSDPLYTRLCRAQNCFRARITPKYWRCGVDRPPRGFPRKTREEEARFASWLTEYERNSADYATCAAVGTFGNEEIHPAVFPVLELHDIHTCLQGPLA